MSLKSLLNDTCNIYEIVETRDSFGEPVFTRSLLYANQKCRVTEGYLREKREDELLRVAREPYKIYFEKDISLVRLNEIDWNGVSLRFLTQEKTALTTITKHKQN